jgi:hypothetical protein
MGLNDNLTTDSSLSLVLFDSGVTVGLLNFSERNANLKSSVQ